MKKVEWVDFKADTLKRLCIMNGVTQTTVCEGIGISVPSLELYKKRGQIPSHVAMLLATYFGMPEAVLFTECDPESLLAVTIDRPESDEWVCTLYKNLYGEEASVSIGLLGEASRVSAVEFAMDLAKLTARERAVIRYSYRDQLTISQVAKLYGLSIERIRQILSKAERKLRRRDYIRTILDHGVTAYIYSLADKLAAEMYMKDRLEKRQNPVIPEEPSVQDISDLGIEVLDPSVRLFNCLKRSKVDTIGELLDLMAGPESNLMKIRNMGVRTKEELETKLKERGLWDGVYGKEA